MNELYESGNRTKDEPGVCVNILSALTPSRSASENLMILMLLAILAVISVLMSPVTMIIWGFELPPEA